MICNIVSDVTEMARSANAGTAERFHCMIVTRTAAVGSTAAVYRSEPGCPKLPGLLQPQGNDASVLAVEQIASARIPAAGGYSVLVRSVPIRDVLHHDLDGNVPQILAGWSVTGVIAD